jgi:adenylate kinase
MRDELAIYFAGAVRGGGGTEWLAARIEALSMLGNVLTEHMASARTIAIGDDAAVHAHDQQLLARAHVMIADVTIPSTGTGYMIARAAARGLPILCLYFQGTRPSAMIAGSPDVTTRFYADDSEWLDHARAFLLANAAKLPAIRGPRIFLAGPPGCGKGTLGRWLAKATGAPHVSTGELLRELLASTKEHPYRAELSSYVNAGMLVPAKLMRDIVIERLNQPDCRLFGIVLDGYPPSREDLANLTEAGITADLVLMLECSDEVSIKRQLQRAARPTDVEDKARHRLAVYHAFEPKAEWYPNSLVARVDAEQPADVVGDFALQIVRNALHCRRQPRSYFPIPPAKPSEVCSTRLHFHVDAKDHNAIHAFAIDLLQRYKPAQGQIKIYPIEALHLGAQHGALPIYRQLPNFHPIATAEHEAFITGRLGDGDRALMSAVLELGREREVMVELEEYVCELTLRANGELVEDSTHSLTHEDHTYPAHDEHLCKDIPTWELHHGFDLPKQGEASPPWPLADLVAACASAGFANGGWFLFKHDQHWAYRSNEFSSETGVRTKLIGQVRALHGLLAQRGYVVDVGCSLERVHGIWVF